MSQGFLGDGEKSRISDCQKIKEPIYPLLIFWISPDNHEIENEKKPHTQRMICPFIFNENRARN